MNYEDLIRERITSLRLQKGLSESKLSYELGHSKGYIQSITSGHALPSMGEFLYLCQYFGVTPSDFFSTETEAPEVLSSLSETMRSLSREDAELLLALARRLAR